MVNDDEELFGFSVYPWEIWAIQSLSYNIAPNYDQHAEAIL